MKLNLNILFLVKTIKKTEYDRECNYINKDEEDEMVGSLLRNILIH